MAKALLYFVNRSGARQKRDAKATSTSQGSMFDATKVVRGWTTSRAHNLDGGANEELLVPIAVMKAIYRQPVRNEMNLAMTRDVATLGGTHGE